MQTFIVGLES